jgi:hypothetical protein
MTEEIPEYLRKKSARKRKMMARFRCGNVERENRYWMEGQGSRCKISYKMIYKKRLSRLFKNNRLFWEKLIIFPDSLCFPYYYFIEGKIARPNFFIFQFYENFLL